jgi:ATP phosphoribosyltransferase regulatory subunit
MALPERVRNDLTHFERTLQLIRAEEPDLALTIDPIERRGFEYQTGLSFTIFAQGVGELGRGGRYRIGGKRDGEPATGFTLTTDNLLRAVPAMPALSKVCIAPGMPVGVVKELQEQGYAIVRAFPDEALEDCARRLGCGKLWRDGRLSDVKKA